MSIGNNLRKIRKDKNLTSAEMADILELSPSKYSRIENNQATLDANLVSKITQEFNAPTDKILEGDGKTVLTNPTQHIKGDGIMVQNGNSENERKLYEQIIASQQGTIASQKTQIEMLQAEIARLREQKQ